MTTEFTSERRFGTFGGVFTPSILTILGVVMYMRLGWVVGNVGLAGAMMIIVISHLISVATGLSVSSIATNRKVGAGGAYFMISRTLGAPAGASIGIPLFFAQALSVTFYIVGFTESLQELVKIDQRLLGTVTLALLTLVSLKSADLAIKTQYIVMAAIGLSLIAFFTGTGSHPPEHPELWAPHGAESFEKVFAVFFPAVTGIMAGVSMSGDLKDPRTAIPKGTLWAIGVGFLIYISIPIWLAFNADNLQMIHDKRIVWAIARVPQMIYVGVWGATLSSAIGSILSAPRTLQALGMDGLVPRAFAKGHGASNEPRFGTLFTFALAQVGILLGNLDVIAPILTMFFLATYGVTNLACGLERWANSPSFRPTFRIPALVSLSGAFACFYVMSIINLLAMIASVVICTAIYLYVERKQLSATYGDARHGIYAALVNSALQKMKRVDFHPINWRPHLMILGGEIRRRSHLLEFGTGLVQNRGMVSYFHLLRGSVQDLAARREALHKEIDDWRDSYPNVFFRVDITRDLYRGAVTAAQSYGIGNLEANSVLMGWSEEPDDPAGYLSMLRDLITLDRSVFLLDYKTDVRFGRRRRIHIWWRGLQQNGGKMLMLASLLVSDRRWQNAEITVLTVVESEEQREAARRSLMRIFDAARVDGRPRVLLRENRSITEIMAVESAAADLAMVGMYIADHYDEPSDFFANYAQILRHLPTTLLVYSARHFASELVLFDSDEEQAPEPEPDSRESSKDDENEASNELDPPQTSRRTDDESPDGDDEPRDLMKSADGSAR
ncbi:MAG: hypothetical protein KC609_16880 [Myxococcales bacterium]|nr:hypothetical protein [Myxococcales bacterium]